MAYKYRVYKRHGLWLVRKRRLDNSSVVYGPFDCMAIALFWVKEDCRIRAVAFTNMRLGTNIK